MDKSKQASFVYDKIAEPYAKEFSKPSEYIEEFLDLLPHSIHFGLSFFVILGHLTS